MLKKNLLSEKDLYYSTSEKSFFKKKGVKTLLRNFFVYLFPFLKWMRHYSLKRDLKWDIIAGITTSIAVVAQALVSIHNLWP